MSAQVLKLVETGRTLCFKDLPACLRALADDIERGGHGIAEAKELHGDNAIARCVVVLRVSNQEPAVFAYGSMENVAQAYMDLHAGAQELMNMGAPGR